LDELGDGSGQSVKRMMTRMTLKMKMMKKPQKRMDARRDASIDSWLGGSHVFHGSPSRLGSPCVYWMRYWTWTKVDGKKEHLKKMVQQRMEMDGCSSGHLARQGPWS
jgi:hypothetical protein